jgi:Lon protease-like protein
LKGGGFLAVLAGEERIVVRMWLPDDPYPLALVVEQPQGNSIGLQQEQDSQIDELETLVRRALWAGAEAGHSLAPATFSLPGPAPYLLYQLTQLAPISVLDKQRVLEADDRSDAEQILKTALTDVISLFLQWMESEGP